MIKVGIVGGTGYTGVELLRLLAAHPQAEVVAVTSRTEAGIPVAQTYPSLRGFYDLCFTEPDKAPLADCDVVFFATPNGTAMKDAQALLDAGVKVIDLAADFRLKDIPEWEQWYDMQHASPSLVAEAVYGLPEMNRDAIRQARLVANPGCYPTAVQLGLLPLIKAEAIELDNLIADCKSGVSGSGRRAVLSGLYTEAADSFRAYGVDGHRHLPEIRQGLSIAAGHRVGLTFVPHLTPMIRGIHATLYATLKRDVDVQALYEQFYAQEGFVDVMPIKRFPDTRSVRGANLCRIAAIRPQQGNTVVIMSVIDNLVKGAAGQAIQNMNLMFGQPEQTGLQQVPMLP